MLTNTEERKPLGFRHQKVRSILEAYLLRMSALVQVKLDDTLYPLATIPEWHEDIMHTLK